MNKEKAIDVLERLSETVNQEEHNPIEANGIDRAIAAIQELPDDDAWIPVTERFPEDGTTVWVTVNNRGDLSVREGIYSDQFFWNQRKTISLNYIVTAWKPREIMLPYKEES